MGFLKGPLNIKRFFVDPIDVLKDAERAVDRINHYSFRSIEGVKYEQSSGWVSPFRIYDSEVRYEDTVFGDFLFVTMRTDRKSIPPLLLEAKTRERIESEKVVIHSRQDFKNIKESVREDLLIAALPTPSITEGMVDLKRTTLYLNTASRNTAQVFLSLFEKTFEVMPQHVGAASFAMLCIRDENLIEKLSMLKESSFHE